MSEVQAPYNSKNLAAEDLLLLIKGRYSSPRSLRESLSLLIHVHYGVSVEHYQRHQRDTMSITLGLIGEIVPSVLYKSNNVQALFRVAAEKADKDGNLKLDDITTSLLNAVRWGALEPAEKQRLESLTIDEKVEEYLANYNVTVPNHCMVA